MQGAKDYHKEIVVLDLLPLMGGKKSPKVNQPGLFVFLMKNNLKNTLLKHS